MSRYPIVTDSVIAYQLLHKVAALASYIEKVESPLLLVTVYSIKNFIDLSGRSLVKFG